MIETEKDEPDFKLFGKVFYHYLPSSESPLSIDLPGESENQKQFRNHHLWLKKIVITNWSTLRFQVADVNNIKMNRTIS
jgi:hypothetical protein